MPIAISSNAPYTQAGEEKTLADLVIWFMSEIQDVLDAHPSLIV